jgi:DNA-binding NarL/FixJ family response regulator
MHRLLTVIPGIEFAAHALMCLDFERNYETRKLTYSEAVLAIYLATDKDTKAICEDLSLAISTIRTYSRNIYEKMDIHTRRQVALKVKEILDQINLSDILNLI